MIGLSKPKTEEHSFIAICKMLTGFPPFHNFRGTMQESTDAAQRLNELAEASVVIYTVANDPVGNAEWCSKNCIGHYVCYGNKIVLDNHEDAVLCKLTFA